MIGKFEEEWLLNNAVRHYYESLEELKRLET